MVARGSAHMLVAGTMAAGGRFVITGDARRSPEVRLWFARVSAGTRASRCARMAQ